MRSATRVLVLLAAILMLPYAAYAQATIAGVVREVSGAVLPGVTVEVSSPALTEKVRTVVTDGTGQYRVVTLPPGAYVVKFTLTGFSTVQRDGVTVSGSGVIPINVEMQVGALAETIVVTESAPLVDTQTTRRETVLTAETIASLPITRNYGGVLPGVTVEASSPALIEKVRTAVTDGTGQYRIENLRPGVYAVTFTIPGFSVVRREGLE